MADILIRDVPESVVIAIDTQARRLGISRTEYIRRCLAAEVRVSEKVTIDDLRRFAEAAAELNDPAVMRGAWS